jgi:hypothetical protein
MTTEAREFLKGARPGVRFTFGGDAVALQRELLGYGFIEPAGERGVSGEMWQFTRKVERWS